MNWVLIIVLSLHSTGELAFIEGFPSERSCLEAGRKYGAAVNYHTPPKLDVFVCVDKSHE